MNSQTHDFALKSMIANRAWREAQTMLSAALARDPKNAALRQQRRALTQDIARHCDPDASAQDRLMALYDQNGARALIDAGAEWAARYPDSPLVWKLLAGAYQAGGHLSLASKCLEQALQLAPEDVDCLNSLADMLNSVDTPGQAIPIYEHVLALDPQNVHALANLANTYRTTGDLARAAPLYDRARALGTHHAMEMGYLALLIAQERLKDAEAVLHSFDLRAPDRALCLNAIALYDALGALPKAIDFLTQLMAQDGVTAARKLQEVSLRMKCGDWSWYDQLPALRQMLEQTEEAVPPLPVLTIIDDPKLQRQVSERFARSHFPNVDRAPFTPPAARPRKLRIGYFSSDFYNHATMHLMRSFFATHDADAFEVFLYTYGRAPMDSYREQLIAEASHFHDVAHLTDKQIAAQARADGLDIAVDLKGYTRGSRSTLFAHGAAPIQIAWLGYPGTLGHPCFDYAIVDPNVVPAATRDGFSEALIVMPHCYQVNDATKDPVTEIPSRASEGLPEDAFVYCCFNNSSKITPVEFDIWMRLLYRTEGSVLWLLESTPWFAQNMRRETAARGVDPDRLIFAKRCAPDLNIARQSLADLFLDTFCYTAHTTASDALFAGLPVLTLQGAQFSARVASSLLAQLGLEDLVTHDAPSYEAAAMRLSSNPGHLRALRARLHDHKAAGPLFDTVRFTRALEHRLWRAFDRYQAGLPPSDLH